jgi:hypothetical protein
MVKIKDLHSNLFDYLLSEETRKKTENVILKLALFSFLIHIALIYFFKLGLVDPPSNSDLLNHPISAIYTPFSFILIYEVYLLIYYLPKSFTTYINKQYEIITLL